MSDIAEHCEAKKHAYRQTQDGVVVSFVLHPQEVPAGLALAALGTRYMLAVAEIGDDEQPKPVMADAPNRDEVGKITLHYQPGMEKVFKPEKPKREMTLANRIAILCEHENFQTYLLHNYNRMWAASQGKDAEECAAIVVRNICGVKSRSEILYDTTEAAKWKQLYTEYESWIEGRS